MEEKTNKELSLDENILDSESENDDHVQEVEEPEQPKFSENSETFSYTDGTKSLTLTSKFFNVFQLCQLGADFLGLKSTLQNKSPPSYTK